jgi:PAS domain S-box-containing protein
MTSAGRVSSADDLEPAVNEKLATANAVLALSIMLTQAPSPCQVIRLATSAVSSIAHGRKALVWHPNRSGDYYKRAPDHVSDTLARLKRPDRLEMGDESSWWVFPLASPPTCEPVFLVIVGCEPLSDEEIFLLSVLAQQCGTAISKLELIQAEKANAQRIAALNAELESTVSRLTRGMEIHRRLNEIVANAGEAGIAETLHLLTMFPVLTQDVHGNTRAAVGDVPAGYHTNEQPKQRQEVIRRMQIARRAVYYRRAWLALANPRSGVLGVIVLIDPARSASETDIAALEYAATVLSVELGRLHSVAEAELRSQATRERDLAQARAAALATSEARQQAILEAALDAVISIDGHGRITYVNSAFEQIFGYRADDVIGCKLAEMVVPPSLRGAHQRGFARYLATGKARILGQRIEMTAMRADGSEFPAELTIARSERTGEPTFTGYVRDITERQRAKQQLLASRVRLVSASDEVRRRIERDLHDGAQQRFVTTILNLQLAEREWEIAPERARELLGLAVSDARRGLDGLREVAAGIHPAVLTERGLAAAIGTLARRLPIPVQLDVSDRRLPAPIEASVYFFCCEALTNVVKHASATSAWVRVKARNHRCLVEVRDDGIGGAKPRSETSGLSGLRDRIGALSGTLDISSPAAGGTVLRARIPLRSDPIPDRRPTRMHPAVKPARRALSDHKPTTGEPVSRGRFRRLP